MSARPSVNRKIVYAKRPVGEPDLACFKLVEEPVGAPGEGQVLVRNDYVSVDPYIRMRMEEKDSYAPVMKLGETMVGRTIAEVIESRHADFRAGDWVVGRLGWQDYSVAAAAELQKIDPTKAPLTAYFGFDACVDYKSPNFAQALRAAVPSGVDVYFENVGGMVLDTVLPLLNNGARIPLCGMVSQYNAVEPYGVRNLRELFNHRVTLRAFVLSDHRDLWPAASRELEAAYAAGELQSRETVAAGLENAPQAFIDMLRGGNIGKQIVRLR